MDLEQAAANFKRGMTHADNLVHVHRQAGTGLQGRRTKEVSINRAVVVVTVAAWQAAVQDMTTACVDNATPDRGDPYRAVYDVVAGRLRSEVGAFATPNAENSRKLLKSAGFDPRPLWKWSQRGGRGRGMVAVSPKDADTQINQWLKVRHAIAHGHEHLPAEEVLEAVRQSDVPLDDPALRLADATRCLTFFRRLVKLTGDGLAKHMSVPEVDWSPTTTDEA